MKLRELVDPPRREAAVSALRAAHAEAAEPRDPVVLKALTGLSAWVASLFLLGFVVAGLQAEDSALLVLGVIFSALAAVIHQKAPRAGTFVQQSTLSCMMCGHLLLLFGILVTFRDGRGDELLTLAITQTGLCVLPLVAFRHPTYQAAALLLAAALWTVYAVEHNAPWLFRLLLALQVFSFAALVLWRARRNSVSYALALSIGATIFFLDWIHSHARAGSFDEPLWPTNLIIAALLVAIASRFIARVDRQNKSIILLLVLLLGLAFLSSPGLLFAFALLTLGYGLRDRIYGGLGLIALPLFLVFFYYSLEVTLLQKSGILLASGLLCLALSLLAGYGMKERASV